MVDVPSANTSVQATAGGVATGLDLICVLSPCAQNADAKPRIFGKAADIYAMHGYCEGVDFSEIHVRGTRKAIMFCGLPIATPGVVGRKNTGGNHGSSVVDVVAGADGVLGEHGGQCKVLKGGTVGTDQILLEVSLDDGVSSKRVRLGTANSYTIPYFGVSLTFGAGTLTADDVVITWQGSAPRSDASGWTSAREKLAAQMKGFRSGLLIGDLQSSTEANAFVGEINTYETANQRFTTFRASVLDRLPLAFLSHVVARMSGNPSITFAEVGASGDTITRSVGSFIADGFVVGDTITVTGAVASAGANNVTGVIASLSATVITLGTTDLAAEGPISGVGITAVPTLTFAEVGASADTITRNRGSWLDDGFRVGDKITVAGTVSNNFAAAQGLAAVTATVLTLGTDDLVAEAIGVTSGVTVTTGQTKAAWMAASDAAFSAVDGQKRINLSAGRGRVYNPFTGWFLRRPVAWADATRSYQHDLHRTTLYKADGILDGWDLFDSEKNLVEWDDRTDGGAGSAARFTTFRTWSNGPDGTFITISLTRDTEGSVLQKQHNLEVTNLACTTVQLQTENVVGRSDFVLNDDGTASADSLATVAADVNSALESALLENKQGEGPRASKAVWTPANDDDFTAPDPVFNGVLDLLLNGTVYRVNTTVRVR